MKKLVTILLCLGLTAGVAATASAGKKPVKTTLYLHGDSPVGEGAQGAMYLSDGTVMKLNGDAPTDPVPKSYNFTNPVGNEQCAGNELFFPTWVGTMQGRITGDATWTLHFVSPPSSVIARIWVDVPSGACNEAYVEPAQEVIVEIPAGHNEVDVVFKKLNLKAEGLIMLELLQQDPAAQGRVLYDGADFASAITFQCVPASGSSCI
jgi:hypothetical protein